MLHSSQLSSKSKDPKSSSKLGRELGNAGLPRESASNLAKISVNFYPNFRGYSLSLNHVYRDNERRLATQARVYKGNLFNGKILKRKYIQQGLIIH